MSSKARELLRAAKQKKLENPNEIPIYEVKEEINYDEIENNIEKTNEQVKKNDTENVSEKLKNKLDLFEKKNDQKHPPIPKKNILSTKSEEPKKLIEIDNIPITENNETKSTVKQKDNNDRLMKRLISAKTQKGLGNKGPSKQILGMAGDLESKLKIGIPVGKKFIIEDNDIQKIDQVNKIEENEDKEKHHEVTIDSNPINFSKKDTDEILMEKPILKTRKMTKKDFNY